MIKQDNVVWGWGQHKYCLDLIFRFTYSFELNSIFQVKDIKGITFYVKYLSIGERSSSRTLLSHKFGTKNRFFKALTWKQYFSR